MDRLSYVPDKRTGGSYRSVRGGGATNYTCSGSSTGHFRCAMTGLVEFRNQQYFYYTQGCRHFPFRRSRCTRRGLGTLVSSHSRSPSTGMFVKSPRTTPSLVSASVSYSFYLFGLESSVSLTSRLSTNTIESLRSTVT